jgi:GTP cyclohydrolase I
MKAKAAEVLIGIGSNIGPSENIPAALALLGRDLRITGVSTFYRTTPTERPEQPAFVNGVCRGETRLAARELKFGVLREVERRLGRVRSADRHAARPIDLDLLVYGDEVIEEADLTVPDPEIRRRAFVARPLLELSPELVLPDTGESLRAVAASLPCGELEPDHGLTRRMKARWHRMDDQRVEELVRQLLVEIGEDPEREGLKKTPHRVAAAWRFLTSGYRLDPKDAVSDAVFTSHANNMVIARDIEIYSLCEHHMLPFFGRCHIGYIPSTKVIGVSKLARIVDCYARRLQIQERLTAQVARELMSAIDAVGVGVVMECRHLCMMMRGVEKQNSVMTTSSVLGTFHSDEATRMEFLQLLGRAAP